MYHRFALVVVVLSIMLSITPAYADVPPLPRSCIGGSTPTDYSQPICCVSGYVYLNNAPIAGARVTISVRGTTITAVTQSGVGSTNPFFSVSLDAEPLNVQPGEVVTVSTSVGTATRTRTFVAQPGGQQVDLVLPQTAVDAVWVPGEQTIGPRDQPTIAYDSDRERVVLFGGITYTQNQVDLKSDTWEWDGSTWIATRGIMPPPRRVAGMAYDTARRRTVLFGGLGGATANDALNDTWEWDGIRWTQQIPTLSPSPRANFAMAYNPLTRRTMIFGGIGAEGYLNDTWEWDGTTWHQLAPSISPGAQGIARMVFDGARQQLILVWNSITSPVTTAETWIWTGTTWERRYPVQAPLRNTSFVLTYDSEQERVVQIGVPYDAPSSNMEMWLWDGTLWTKSAVPSFPSRSSGDGVYDAARQRIVYFGGSIYSLPALNSRTNETWTFDGHTWSTASPRSSPPSQSGHALTYDPIRQRTLLFGSNVDASTWEWDGTHWTNRTSADSPHPRVYHSIVFDTNRQRAVLFGGYGIGSSVLNDTWEWNGNTWIKHSPVVAPSARAYHAMAYDAARQKVVLFGGYDGKTYLPETWEWDGTTWTKYTPQISPVQVSNHRLSMTYDSERKRVILYGAWNSATPQTSGVWEWDGVSWVEHTPAVSPKLNGTSAIVYDAARKKVVLVGGRGGSDELWEWDGVEWTQRQPKTLPPNRTGFALSYDSVRQKVVLFGGSRSAPSEYPLNDTWEWDGTNWTFRADDTMIPNGFYSNALFDGALSYERDGRTLLFGGQAGDTSPSGQTYVWQGNQWQHINSQTAPSGRVGHRLARNSDGSKLLLFGGQNATGYTNDTWAWTGKTWVQYQPQGVPTPRGYVGLTYDRQREVWVLFGGQDSSRVFGDTWEYNGTTWVLRSPAVQPPARSRATLTYDTARMRSVLVGGQNAAGQLLNDVWEWDGATWTQIRPAQAIPARTNHGATYDSVNGAVVLVGGLGATGVLSDIWEWDGSAWTRRTTNNTLPAMSGFGMDFDGLRGELVVSGGQNGSGFVRGTYLHQVLGAVSNPTPVATISRINPRDARQGYDTIHFDGLGADADQTDSISAYRWTIDDTVIGTEASIAVPADALPLGVHTVRFEVQDDEGAWSAPIAQQVIIRNTKGGVGSGKTWTHLIYAVGDNNLYPWMGDYQASSGMLHRLRTSGPQPGVHVAVLYDGPSSDDTRLYTLDESGVWKTVLWQNAPEARMDEMETLRDFIRWGRQEFTTDYLAVSLLDHASGVVGFGEDRTSNASGKAFLDPIELRSALQASTDDGARKIDVLHFDGCSFALVEDAAIADGLVHYVVASPNTGWGVFAYDRYRERAAQAADPRAYATAIAQTYATAVASQKLPYTISVFDMAQFARLKNAVSALGNSLVAYVTADPVRRITELKLLRAEVQKYDSGGSQALEIDKEDVYIDVLDLARQLRATVNDSAVTTAAEALEQALTGPSQFVAYESHSGGQFLAYDAARAQDRLYKVSLERVSGVALYYPPRSSTDVGSTYARYTQDRLFESTRDSGWTAFLLQGLPPLSAGDPPPQSADVLLAPLLTATVKPAPDSTSITIGPDESGFVASPEGRVRANFPTGSVRSTTTISYTAGSDLRGSLPTDAVLLHSFALRAWTASGYSVTQLERPYTLVVTYTDDELNQRDLQPGDPDLLLWDGSQWISAITCPWCRVDRTTHTITVLTQEMTEFALVDYRHEPQAASFSVFLPVAVR